MSRKVDSYNKCKCGKVNCKKDCKKVPCNDDCVKIKSLPYTIDKSGKYCLCKDLIYHGVNVGISIEVDGVSVDGNFHKISLANAGSGSATTWNPVVGIKVNGPTSGNGRFKNITIKNVIVESLINVPNPAPLPPSPSGQSFSVAVLLNGASSVNIKNCVFYRTTHGIETQNVNGLLVEDSDFVDNYGVLVTRELGGAAIFLQEDSQNLKIERCNFSGQATENGSLVAFGFNTHRVTTNIRNISVLNSNFNNTDGALFFSQCTNLLIEGCNIFCERQLYFQVQMGSFTVEQRVDNLIFRNTNIWARSNIGTQLFSLLLGDGALIQNVNLNYNSSVYIHATVIGVGAGGLGKFTNAVFDNITIQGPNHYGIQINNADGTTVKNSHIADSSNAIQVGNGPEAEWPPPVRSSNITIINNEITGPNVDPLPGGSVGIELFESTSAVVKDNRIRSFCTAILLDPLADGNVIEGNTITNNGNGPESIVGNTVNNLVTRFNVDPNPNLFYNNTRVCAVSDLIKTHDKTSDKKGFIR